jgi:hypothetical protein
VDALVVLPLLALQQIQRAGALDRLNPIMDVELSKDALEMIAGCPGSDEELLRDFRSREPGRE